MAEGLRGASRQEMMPILWQIGRAAFLAQGLEIQLLMLILDLDRRKLGEGGIGFIQDHPAYGFSIGEMFEELRAKAKLPRPVSEGIRAGIAARNELVHHLWSEERTAATVTASGRAWLAEDLSRMSSVLSCAIATVHDLRIDVVGDDPSPQLHCQQREAAIQHQEDALRLM